MRPDLHLRHHRQPQRRHADTQKPRQKRRTIHRADHLQAGRQSPLRPTDVPLLRHDHHRSRQPLRPLDHRHPALAHTIRDHQYHREIRRHHRHHGPPDVQPPRTQGRPLPHEDRPYLHLRRRLHPAARSAGLLHAIQAPRAGRLRPHRSLPPSSASCRPRSPST